MNLRKLILSFFLGVFSLLSSAQPHLAITNLSGFPVLPSDSAYESVTYDSISITVQNIDTASITDTLSVYARAGTGAIDTVYSDSGGFTLSGGASRTFMRSNYHFTPLYYDDGDNIVVVWPSARYSNIIADTVHLEVYFISLLQSVAGISNTSILLGPNPATDFIALKVQDKNTVKQVRIYDVTGRLVFMSAGQTIIPVGDLKSGVYFLEIMKADGLKECRRVEKE